MLYEVGFGVRIAETDTSVGYPNGCTRCEEKKKTRRKIKLGVDLMGCERKVEQR